jgi:hypothetical protein
MVAGARSKRGATTLGCLFGVMVIVALLYYGLDIGRTYWKYYHLKDEMETSARFAQTQTDDVIMKHLVGVAQDLGLPAQAQRFVITRGQHPPAVTIRTHYDVTIVLPFKHKVVTLRPEVEVR